MKYVWLRIEPLCACRGIDARCGSRWRSSALAVNWTPPHWFRSLARREPAARHRARRSQPPIPIPWFRSQRPTTPECFDRIRLRNGMAVARARSRSWRHTRTTQAQATTSPTPPWRTPTRQSHRRLRWATRVSRCSRRAPCSRFAARPTIVARVCSARATEPSTHFRRGRAIAPRYATRLASRAPALNRSAVWSKLHAQEHSACSRAASEQSVQTAWSASERRRRSSPAKLLMSTSASLCHPETRTAVLAGRGSGTIAA